MIKSIVDHFLLKIMTESVRAETELIQFVLNHGAGARDTYFFQSANAHIKWLDFKVTVLKTIRGYL